MASSTVGSAALTSFEPTPSSGASGQDLVAECVGCIISGRPLPERVRPPATVGATPATAAAGVARILNGRGAV
jgi:hypothetical protein